MQHSVKENLSKADILCDYQEELRYLLSEFDMHVFGGVNLDNSLHVLLLDKVNDLATVRYNFE